MTHRVKRRRAMATAPRVIAIGYALFLACNRWMGWEPDSYTASLVGLLIAAVLAAIAEGQGNARGPALRAGLLVMGLGGMHFLDWLVPSASKDAFCDAPGHYCEDGLLFFVIPILTLMLALVAASITAVMQALRRWMKSRQM